MSMAAYFRSAGTVRESAIARYSDLLLVAGVIAIVAMMILPLPAWLVDVLVAVNIASGIVLLLLGIYIASPLEFSVFPSVLLMTTLFRLSLSIATTRMILLHGHAGHIIDTFGKVVAGGNLVVGLVVFLIITVVQFIVIAKGAERVAEVAARFSLDAMPGKQLSIDSDLRSGLIDKDEAKRRRRNLEMESKLHGSLDGAMKFVKGDAIAGIVIIVINLLGGLAIGVMMQDLDIGSAMTKYSILTIGEGMVAQIPALLGAMAAGLIVTRTSDEDDQPPQPPEPPRRLTRHVQPLGPRVLVRVVKSPDRSEAGLFLPQGVKDDNAMALLGEVVEVARTMPKGESLADEGTSRGRDDDDDDDERADFGTNVSGMPLSFWN